MRKQDQDPDIRKHMRKHHPDLGKLMRKHHPDLGKLMRKRCYPATCTLEQNNFRHDSNGQPPVPSFNLAPLVSKHATASQSRDVILDQGELRLFSYKQATRNDKGIESASGNLIRVPRTAT
ncbi:hypothetical protein AN477_14405 [Alicyclobacillus ferrooxydans]|uniref:Uncharacterized protein n=1 Tax=Alicyclobacillus ferrooxydans TaxID=471514 RepID=A0A0N8PP22_9BACL|nr:hypothetical protein AN477_14405 [Alicyclobacillus ferrooxydans]